MEKMEKEEKEGSYNQDNSSSNVFCIPMLLIIVLVLQGSTKPCDCPGQKKVDSSKFSCWASNFW